MKDHRFEICDQLKANLKALNEEIAGKVRGGIDTSHYTWCGAICQVTCSFHCRPDCLGFCGDLGSKT